MVRTSLPDFPWCARLFTHERGSPSVAPMAPAMAAPMPAPAWPYCVLFILGTELAERFAFYGFTGSLVCFFKTLGFHADTATELTSLFGACVYVTPVLGAYVADVHWGRYKTILVFCILYIIGLACTTAGAWPTHGSGLTIDPSLALGLSMAGLFLGVTLGAGGIKSNVIVLGADQFELPAQAAQQASFFNFFYFCINIGATAAFLFLANVAVYGLGDLVPQRFGFFVSFSIPLGAFLLAITCFAAGRPLYVTRPAQGSAVVSFASTLGAAAWRGCTSARLFSSPRRLPNRGCLLLLACVALPLAFCVLVTSFFVPAGFTHDVLAVSGLTLILCALIMLIGSGGSTAWVHATDAADGADASLSPSAAAEADAAAVVRLLPLASCVVVFWMIYSQMASNFQLQGFQMDLRTFGTSLSPASLNVFDSLAVMLLIPLVDRILYPCLARLGVRLGMLTKIGIGFGFAMASVLVAAFVERARRSAPMRHDMESAMWTLGDGGDGWLSASVGGNATLCGAAVGGKALPVSSLSVWWQTPQYMLIGFGEIFAAITCYELFYATVPPHMRSVCQSINLLCTAVGALAAAGLNSVCAAWIPNNLNDGHLDYVFFVLAGGMAANLVLFATIACTFERPTIGESITNEGGGESGAEPLLALSDTVIDSIGPGVRLSASRLSSRLSSRSSSNRITSNRSNVTIDLWRSTASTAGDEQPSQQQRDLADPLIGPADHIDTR